MKTNNHSGWLIKFGLLVAWPVLLLGIASPAATFTAVTNGNWSLGATWGNPGDNTAGSGVPGSADAASIPSPYTVTYNSGSPTTVGTVTVGGTLKLATTGTFGDVTINNGGTFTNTANVNLTFSGNVTNNGAMGGAGGSATYTYGGAAKTLSGFITNNVASFSGSYKNVGTFVLGTGGNQGQCFSGSGSLTNLGTLIIGANQTPFPTISTLAASAVGNNVIHLNGTLNATPKATAYYNLTFNGGGNPQLNGGGLTIANNFTNAGSGAISTWPANGTIGGTLVHSSSGASSIPGSLTIGGLLLTGGILNSGSGTITVTGSGAGTWTVAGGSFVQQNNLVKFTGGAPDIAGTTATPFYKLTFDAACTNATASTNFNVSNTLTNNGNFTPGAGVVINNGGAQGTLIGSGNLAVTRTNSTANLVSQYKFSTYTLTNMVVNYAGAGNQSINTNAVGSLATSGSGIKTAGATLNVRSNITEGAGTVLDISSLTNSAYTLASTQSFFGSGVLKGSLGTTSGSKVYAGTDGGYGTNTIATNLTMVSDATVNLDIGSTAGGANDLLVVSNTLALNNTVFNLKAPGTNATIDMTDYVLVTAGNITGTPTLNWVVAPYAGNYYSLVTSATQITLHTCVPPSVSDPTNLTVCAGEAANFTVSAGFTASPVYQWKKNGGSISDATNATLTINPVSAGDAGTYSCTVSGVCGSPAVSAGATLTVFDALSDADGDGVDDCQEIINGTDPNDYYNGVPPCLTLVGDNQVAPQGNQLLMWVSVFITAHDNTVLTNAPLMFGVGSGAALFAASTNGTLTTNLLVRTDAEGVASALLFLPTNTFATNELKLQAVGATNAAQLAAWVTDPHAGKHLFMTKVDMSPMPSPFIPAVKIAWRNYYQVCHASPVEECCPPPPNTTNLWLDITSVSNGVAQVRLTNTASGTRYVLLSRTSFSSGCWGLEQYVDGADGYTDITVQLNGRPILFFLGGLGTDGDSDGLPDAFEVLCSHTLTNVTDTGSTGTIDGYKDTDGDGLSNIDEFRLGTDPSIADNPLSLIEVAGIESGIRSFQVNINLPTIDPSRFELLIDGYIAELAGVTRTGTSSFRVDWNTLANFPDVYSLRLALRPPMQEDIPLPASASQYPWTFGPALLVTNTPPLTYDYTSQLFGSQMRFAGFTVPGLSYDIQISQTNDVLVKTISGVSDSTDGYFEQIWDLIPDAGTNALSDDSFKATILLYPPAVPAGDPQPGPFPAFLPDFMRSKAPNPHGRGTFTLGFGWDSSSGLNKRRAMIQNGVTDIVFNPSLDNEYSTTGSGINSWNGTTFFMFTQSGPVQEQQTMLNDMKLADNFFFCGHGNGANFGSKASDTDPAQGVRAIIFNYDVQTNLNNVFQGAKGWKHNDHPYRFVVLNTCESFDVKMCQAFGIQPIENAPLAFFQKDGRPAQAFVGWKVQFNLPIVGNPFYDCFDEYQLSLATLYANWMAGAPLHVCLEQAADVDIGFGPCGLQNVKINPNYGIYGWPNLTRDGQNE